MKPITGHCGKCGAPYYSEQIWGGVTPPPVYPSCACWNIPQTITGTIDPIIYETCEKEEEKQ